MSAWGQKVAAIGCQCGFSDAWRCAVARHLTTVSCWCACHRHLEIERTAAAGGADAVQALIAQRNELLLRAFHIDCQILEQPFDTKEWVSAIYGTRQVSLVNRGSEDV